MIKHCQKHTGEPVYMLSRKPPNDNSAAFSIRCGINTRILYIVDVKGKSIDISTKYGIICICIVMYGR